MRLTEEQYQALLARRSLPSQGVSRGSTPIAPPAKRQKFGNRKTTGVDGVVHDSSKEFRRWQELELRERAGEIRHLRRQVPFALVVGRVLVCTYIADFVYEEGAATGREYVPGSHAATIVEDCKSPPTRKLAAYSIKRKLMQAIHGIQIREV